MVNGAKMVGAAMATVVFGALASCGSQSPYCTTVEADSKALDSFGSKRSDAGFGAYAKALTSISEVAPESSKKQWATLAKVTQGVVDTHKQVGFPLEDMDNEDKRKALSEGDIGELNKAYKAFNDTADARASVVADVKKTCDIQLK